ncbi:MAG TPA: hypothetical protein VMF14_12145 [Solirubrobacteraceae bacterium]|nr:hypothetical protein [Solirubrobacteraceae bacterium]
MKLALIHLVRRANGPAPLQRFLDSYAGHRPGIDHELVLALKGFDGPADAAESVAAARRRGLDPGYVLLPDDGLDLTAYARVVATVPADRYCFTNSYSRVLADDWLAHLDRALQDPTVHVAGATGSWASHQDYRRYHLHLSSGYDTVFAGREPTRQGFLALTRRHLPDKRDHGRVAFKLAAAADMVRDRGAFASFPSAHLRTNAFAARRELLTALELPRIRGKRDAYRWESGRSGFTRRVLESGGRVVVVARDGSLYDPGAWPRSLTFWSGEQENLLVADNQTEEYQAAGPPGRELLSALAWGERPT